jgi:hypothetical protein
MERPQSSLAARAGLRAGYGLGLMTGLADGFRWYGHSGGTNGSLAFFEYNPEHGVGYFFGVNALHLDAWRRIQEILRRYLTHGREPFRGAEAQVSEEALRPFSGYYRYATPRTQIMSFVEWLTRVVRVEADGGRLRIGSPFGGELRTLVPVGDAFFRGDDESVATVAFADDGGESFLLRHERAGVGSYRRVSAFSAWAPAMVALGSVVLLLSSLSFALVWVRFAVEAEVPSSESPVAP